MLQQAAGPAAAGALVAALSPGHAIAGMAVCHLVAVVTLGMLRRDTSDAAAPDDGRAARHPLPSGVYIDLREGVAYTVRTPWLKWTLLFAVVWVFLLIGLGPG